VSELQKLIEAIIDIKVKNQELFSAYDITQATRSCTSQEIEHEEVKKFVHDYMLGVAEYEGISNGQYIEYSLKINNIPVTTTQKLSCLVRSKQRVTIPKDILDKLFGSCSSVRFDGKTLGDLKTCPNGKGYVREHGYARVRIPHSPVGDTVSFIIHPDKLELE